MRPNCRLCQSFNIVFDEKAYDERLYARAAARYIGSNHTELLLTGDDVRRSLPEALAAYDQPSMDGLNTYFVSKAVRDAGMIVALSGVVEMNCSEDTTGTPRLF